MRYELSQHFVLVEFSRTQKIVDLEMSVQFVEHVSSGLNYSPFDVNWIPNTAKILVSGETARATGVLGIYELEQGKLTKVHEVNESVCHAIVRSESHQIRPE